jgi:outer membrane protein
MSKVLSGLLLAGLLGTASQADVLRVEMGGGIWENELSGTITSGTPAVTIDTDILAYEKEKKGYAWLNIKHPIPVLPNLRLEYAAIDYSGTSTASFVYDGKTYAANSTSDLTLDQFDIIMYYNLLDNTAWTTLDLGIDVKVIQSELNAADSLGAVVDVHEKETLPVPMAYGRLRFEIPGVDIGLEGNMKYSAYKNSKIMDYAIKADYTLVDVLPVDIGLEVGYRFQQLDIDGTDFSIDTTADIEIDGVFAGAVIKF